MKRLITLIIILILSAHPAFSQNSDHDRLADAFIRAFEKALHKNDASQFVEKLSLSTSQLQKIVDHENQMQNLGPGDPNRFTVEMAETFMTAMHQGFTADFNSGINAIETLRGIDFTAAEIVQIQATRSYYEPPMVDINVMARADGEDFYLSFSNLSLFDGKILLGPSSSMRIEGYEVQDVIAHHIIVALKNQDAAHYVDNVLASPEDFESLLRATFESGGGSANIDADEAYEQTKSRLILDFDRLVAKGIDEGIVWSGIEKTWSGLSATLQGEVYQSSIPFQFLYNGREYRVVLDYCTQLRTRRSVFLPGEFRWEGRM